MVGVGLTLLGPLCGAGEWPGNSALVAVSKVTADGVLYRLGRGTPPQESAMRRTTAASGPVAYWPLEDGSSATQLASALPGEQAMTATGTITVGGPADWALGSRVIRYGTQAVVDLAAGPG
ncbi:hypothetical protein [Polymorphospora rubra]|uniref:hypothetical protein n=1 Tax=Polymorphospora rubra TaxID=338584 RepID=UPI0033E1B4AF